MVHLPFLVRCDGFLPERFVLPSSEAQAGKPRTVKLMPRGAIDVTVLDADGRPVPGANVEVQVSDPRRSYATRTGSDGRVEAVAPAGRQVLVGAISSDRGSGTVLATAPAAVTIRLKPPKSAGPRIVAVMASDTEPLAGARIRAGNGKTLPVGEDGRVEVPGTTDWVYVMAPGKATALLDIEDVEEGAETVVRLDPGRDVAVTVLDHGGRPVTGVRLYVTSRTNRSFPVPTTFTDSNGVAALLGLPLHTEAFVTAKHHGFTDARAWVAPDATKATVRIAPWGEVVIRLGGTGLRAGQPISWRWRTLDRTPFAEEAGEVAAQWVPDDSGKVRITVPCGRIALMVECADAAPRVYPDVTVAPDRPGEVAYDFPEPGRAAITVRDEDGNYVEAARLFVSGVNWHFAWTTGRGKIPPDKRKRVPAGRLRIAVSGEGLATVITEPIDLSSPDPVEITLPKGVSVRGVLVDAAGKPVAGRIRILTHVDQPDRFDEAGDDGRFVLARRLAPGPHLVRVHGRGHRPIVVPIRVTEGESARVELPVE
jgi:hypothetical protein